MNVYLIRCRRTYIHEYFTYVSTLNRVLFIIYLIHKWRARNVKKNIFYLFLQYFSLLTDDKTPLSFFLQMDRFIQVYNM